MPPHGVQRVALVAALALFALPAPARTETLSAWLSPEAQRAIQRAGNGADVSAALARLEAASGLGATELRRLLGAPRVASYLPRALPQLADLAGVRGLDTLVRRFASNGQGAAYELAVAHAHRQNLAAVSPFSGDQELDGLLRSGTVIESKSAQPRRPEHLFEQIRRRAQGGRRIVLALGYVPPETTTARLRALSAELGGRLEVQHIPLGGGTARILVEGHNVEDPAPGGPGRIVLASPRPQLLRPFSARPDRRMPRPWLRQSLSR